MANITADSVMISTKATEPDNPIQQSVNVEQLKIRDMCRYLVEKKARNYRYVIPMERTVYSDIKKATL